VSAANRRFAASKYFAPQNLAAGEIYFRRGCSITQGSQTVRRLGITQKQLDELRIALVKPEE
jgi:hypothetical protein